MKSTKNKTQGCGLPWIPEQGFDFGERLCLCKTMCNKW